MAKILLLDTSGSHCIVLLDDNGKVSSMIETEPRVHAHRVLSQVQAICLASNLTLRDLDAISVVAGPGSFTGLRIGVGVVQGLAQASSKPVILISNLTAMAQSAFQRYQLPGQLVATRARDGEVYFAAYRVDANGIVVLQAAEQVAAPSALLVPRLALDSNQWVGVGDAWKDYGEDHREDYREHRQSLIATLGMTPKIIDPESGIDPPALCLLVQSMYDNGEMVSALQVLPRYIKENMHYRQAH